MAEQTPFLKLNVPTDNDYVGDDLFWKENLEKIDTFASLGGGQAEVPSNVILFEDWVDGETVVIDTTSGGTPTPDTTAPVLTITTGGAFSGTKSVTMSTNESATIYYTTDGSTPTTSSNVYSSALSFSSTTTLKAFARDTAGNQSAVQTVTYTLDNSAPADTTAPILTLTPAATFSDTQTVNMSVNETATIWYTVDDTDPTTSGTRVQYTTAVTLTATTTIKAYAVDSANNTSAVQTVTYTKQVSSTLFSDDFNRTDGGIGTNWTYAGTAQVLSNQTGFTANFTSFPNKDVAVSDNISVEMDFILPTLVTGNISGLAVRLPSTSNAQAILFGAKNNGTKLGFLSTLSGTSVLPADVDFTFVAGQSYRFKVEVTGNVYKCYVDGVLKFTYTDTNSIGLTNTRHGFCFYNTTVPRGDNFLIKSL